MTDHEHNVLTYRWNMICLLIRWKLIRERTWDELDTLFKVKNFYVPIRVLNENVY